MNDGRASGIGNRESAVHKPQQADAAIRAEGLGKTYAEGKMRTPVFDGLDLSVAPGETVAITLDHAQTVTLGSEPSHMLIPAALPAGHGSHS
jgi:hypothetical protein